MNKLESLRCIVENFGHGELTPGPISVEQLSQFDLVRARMGPRGLLGIRRAGVDGLNTFCELLLKDDAYSRAASFEELVDVVLGETLELFFDRAGSPIGNAELTELEDRLGEWLNEGIADRTVFVPCMITTTPAPDFLIGPVSFQYIDSFAAEFTSQDDWRGIGRLIDMMRSGRAAWMARVDVSRCRQERAWELGQVAIDLALVGLQLVVPFRDSRRMARLYGRTQPSELVTFSTIASTHTIGFTNQGPGLRLGPGALEVVMARHRDVLDAIGNRVAAFIGDESELPALDRAWADAAYWFHEGLAEPLDTVAVPKLETSIEVLFRAESATGSESRLIEAIEVFYGLQSDSPINPTSQQTVKQFARRFVRERSRILHGTQSTLRTQLGTSPENLAELSAGLLRGYAVLLDRYRASPSPTDDIKSLMAWVRTQWASEPS